jgi:filamentous hemagglutinin family protein
MLCTTGLYSMTCIHRRNIRRLSAFHAAGAAGRFITTAMVMASTLPALQAHAAPAVGEITAGAGSISQQGATTTITQAASQTQQPARMVINWNSFSSAPNESIIFNQPNAAAIALNRVTGTQPSELMGRLIATGQVFILNPNGVLFGAGSQVNVRGLLASTLGMDNAGFINGNYVLQGSNASRVVNRGDLVAADGGYVALVGEGAINIGNIVAKKGDALLAAGAKVTLRRKAAA